MLFVAGDITGGQLVDLEDGTVVRKYVVATPQKNACVYCPATNVVVAHQPKNCAVMLSPHMQQPVQRSFTPETVSSCVVTSCGTMMIAGTVTGSLLLWNMKSGQLVRNCKAHLRAVTSISISGNDTLVVTASEDSVCKVWTLAALSALTRYEAQPVSLFTGHTLGVQCCRFMHHSQSVITGSADKTCRVFDALTAEQQSVMSIGDCVSSLAVSRDDCAIVVGTERGYLYFKQLYNGLNGLPVQSSLFYGRDTILKEPSSNSHETPIIFIAFSPTDSQSVLTVSQGGVLLWYDVSDGRLLGECFHKQPGRLFSCCLVPKVVGAVKPGDCVGLSKNPLDSHLSEYTVQRLEMKPRQTSGAKRARDKAGTVDNTVQGGGSEMPPEGVNSLEVELKELRNKNDQLEKMRTKLRTELQRHQASGE